MTNPLSLETSDLDPITPEEDAVATAIIAAVGRTRQSHDTVVRAIRDGLSKAGAVIVPGWQPIETAPLGDADNGPFFDVCWQGETHRYLPVLHRETDCYNDGRGIKREHGYPSMTKVFLRKPTHWLPQAPAPSAHSIQSGGEGVAS